MGENARAQREPESVRAFTRAILRDLHALERIIAEGMIEAGQRRIGMEQELFLVDSGWRPAPLALEVLGRLGEGPYTTELGRFNLEINLDPVPLGEDCFSAIQRSLESRLEAVRAAARQEGAEIVLTGILPSLRKSDLSLESITPKDRYFALNEAVTQMRGGPLRLQIQGVDELFVEHDSVMLEASNTSCQVHLQVDAEEFAGLYNTAQAVIGPVLAAAVNSPLLFGKRLWSETRIALFRQSVDTRAALSHLRERTPRVRFGDAWVKDSVAELFQEDIARFRALLPARIEEDSLDLLDAGGVPRLAALQLHNSTIYRWNRPCYGIGEGGRPHLRIECRALPSGPSPVDEIANAAFWIGCVLGLAAEIEDVARHLDFDDARGNFIAAARHGLDATFSWIQGETVGARDLILQRLLPIARTGLARASVGGR